ncbi:CLUMA_CG012381, isoform A [Clunio marinus]|uniref:CLUMA_CG012381, isoform A n=1 Tax=Clunio marinus TaxID=568069 RepID=A0A1J1IHX0_9DIPT|nr:CLUMA_CG012381, isoform A [Clunio marinus]
MNNIENKHTQLFVIDSPTSWKCYVQSPHKFTHSIISHEIESKERERETNKEPENNKINLFNISHDLILSASYDPNDSDMKLHRRTYKDEEKFSVLGKAQENQSANQESWRRQKEQSSSNYARRNMDSKKLFS